MADEDEPHAPIWRQIFLWLFLATVGYAAIFFVLLCVLGFPALGGSIEGRDRIFVFTAPFVMLGGYGLIVRTVVLVRRDSQEKREHRLAIQRQIYTERHDREELATGLHIKAAELLDSDRAPVRISGLHNLEYLAQENPGRRQVIVNEITAYLQLPYALPVEVAQDPEDFNKSMMPPRDDAREERRVRLTAQAILARHLRPASAELFWEDIDIDLSGAHLEQINFSDCKVRNLNFYDAVLYGADFRGIHVTGEANFVETHCVSNRSIYFDRATFDGYTTFNAAELKGLAVDSFDLARIKKSPSPHKLPSGWDLLVADVHDPYRYIVHPQRVDVAIDAICRSKGISKSKVRFTEPSAEGESAWTQPHANTIYMKFSDEP